MVKKNIRDHKNRSKANRHQSSIASLISINVRRKKKYTASNNIFMSLYTSQKCSWKKKDW
jgi:hypothetical protein